MGIQKPKTTTYHPHGDPQPKQFNHILLDILGTLPEETALEHANLSKDTCLQQHREQCYRVLPLYAHGREAPDTCRPGFWNVSRPDIFDIPQGIEPEQKSENSV